jgi:hypothetical protein
MYVWSLHGDGAILVHRDLTAAPEPFLRAMAPYREHRVVCVNCLVT